MSQNRAKVTVLLSRAEFERFDAYCEQRGFKKSTLIARLIRDHLAESGFRLQRELPIAADREGRR